MPVSAQAQQRLQSGTGIAGALATVAGPLVGLANPVVGGVLLAFGVGSSLVGGLIDPERAATKQTLIAKGYSKEYADEYARMVNKSDVEVQAAYTRRSGQYAKKPTRTDYHARALANRQILLERAAQQMQLASALAPPEAPNYLLILLPVGVLAVVAAVMLTPKGRK